MIDSVELNGKSASEVVEAMFQTIKETAKEEGYKDFPTKIKLAHFAKQGLKSMCGYAKVYNIDIAKRDTVKIIAFTALSFLSFNKKLALLRTETTDPDQVDMGELALLGMENRVDMEDYVVYLACIKIITGAYSKNINKLLDDHIKTSKILAKLSYNKYTFSGYCYLKGLQEAFLCS